MSRRHGGAKGPEHAARLRAAQARLATNVRRVRGERGLTREQLTERLHCADTYVARIERAGANVTMAFLADLAAALEIDLAELFRDPATPAVE